MVAIIKLMADMTILDYVKVFLAEVLGTFILEFIGCMGCITNMVQPNHPILHIGICFGMAVMLAVIVVGHISGCHVNTGVTTLAVILGDFPLVLWPLYVIAQILGAIIGVSLLKAVTPQEYFDVLEGGAGGCCPVLNPEVGVLKGFLVEFTCTSVLLLMVCGTWDERCKLSHDSAPLRLGFGITGLVLACGPYTGCQINPARSFAPALINNYWTNHWVFWMAPLSAAVVVGVTYRLVFKPPLSGKQGQDSGDG